MAEQPPCKRQVVGSIPTRGSNQPTEAYAHEHSFRSRDRDAAVVDANSRRCHHSLGRVAPWTLDQSRHGLIRDRVGCPGQAGDAPSHRLPLRRKTARKNAKGDRPNRQSLHSIALPIHGCRSGCSGLTHACHCDHCGLAVHGCNGNRVRLGLVYRLRIAISDLPPSVPCGKISPEVALLTLVGRMLRRGSAFSSSHSLSVALCR